MWAQSDIDALKAALAQGVLTVKYSGPPAREITYQSLKAMRDLLVSMQVDVNNQGGKPPYTFAGTSKGI